MQPVNRSRRPNLGKAAPPFAEAAVKHAPVQPIAGRLVERSERLSQSSDPGEMSWLGADAGAVPLQQATTDGLPPVVPGAAPHLVDRHNLAGLVEPVALGAQDLHLAGGNAGVTAGVGVQSLEEY